MESTYRVKAFAEMAGVSVRTLHHYDDIGLLRPSYRNASGHRYYQPEDLIQLQQILTLRHLGFSLDDIQQLIDSPVYNLRESLRVQREAIVSEIERLRTVAESLNQMMAAIDALESPDPAVVRALIQGLAAPDKATWMRQFYSDEAWKAIQNRHANTSMEDIAQGTAAWLRLIRDFKNVQHLPAHHPDVQQLAAQMDDLVQQFTGGNAEVEASLARMYADPENIPPAFRAYDDPELQAYMNEALAIYRKGKS